MNRDTCACDILLVHLNELMLVLFYSLEQVLVIIMLP
jgi:hypothetical protein